MKLGTNLKHGQKISFAKARGLSSRTNLCILLRIGKWSWSREKYKEIKVIYPVSLFPLLFCCFRIYLEALQSFSKHIIF